MHKHQTNSRSNKARGRTRGVVGLFLGLIAVVSFCAGCLLFVRVGLTGDHVAALLVPRLERALGWQISLSAIHLSWHGLDKARLTATGLICRSKLDNRRLCEISELSFEVRCASMLRGVLLLDQAFFSAPVVYVSAPTTSATDTKESISAGSVLRGVFLTPAVRSVRVERGSVVALDPHPERSGRTELVGQVRVVGQDVTLNGVESLKVEGEVPEDHATGYFEINGRLGTRTFSAADLQGSLYVKLSGCPLTTLGALASLLGLESPLAHGKLDLGLAMHARNGEYRIEGEAGIERAVLLPGRFFLRPVPMEAAKIRFTGDLSGGTLNLNLAQMVVPGLTLAGTAKAERFGTDDAFWSIAVRHAELDLRKFSPFIPLKLLTPADRDRLAAAGLQGRVTITEASGSGKPSDIVNGTDWYRTLAVHGVLENVSGYLPGFHSPVQNASGRVRVNSDEMLFDGISLTLGGSPIELNGSITSLKATPRMELFVSADASAQDLNPILQSRFVARYMPPWASSIKDPQGVLSMKLDLKGNPSRPKVHGTITLNSFQCQLEGLPLGLKGIRGAVTFEQSGRTEAHGEGFVGETAARLEASWSPDNLTLHLDTNVVPGDLSRLGLVPADWQIGGKIPLLVTLQGKPARPTFTLRLDLKNNGLQIGSLVAKKAGTPFQIEATGTRNPDGVSIEEAYFVIDQARIAAEGTIENSGRGSFLVNLPPRGIQTKDLIPVADPSLQLQPGGRIEGDATIKGGPDWFRHVNVDANIALSHVTLRPPRFRKPWEGLTGKVRWRGETVNASLERVKIGSSLFSGGCSIIGWNAPKVDVQLTAAFLDTTDFTAPPGQARDVTWAEWIRENPVMRFLARSHGTGILKVEKGKTPLRAFSDFHAAVEDNNGILTVPAWRMSFAEGTVRGNAVFDIRANTQRPIALEFQGDNLQMQTVLLADPKRVSISGPVHMEGRMAWNITPKRENHGVYKTGAMEVRLRDGVINRFEILSKIFSLINFGSLVSGRLPDIVAQGLRYSRLSWHMEVFDAKWKVKDLKLISDAARIEASGMYFSDQSRVDFLVDVSPLVGLDTIFSGLFGNLLTKNGKILTTAFRVRGLYTSPDVRLEPLESARSR